MSNVASVKLVDLTAENHARVFMLVGDAKRRGMFMYFNATRRDVHIVGRLPIDQYRFIHDEVMRQGLLSEAFNITIQTSKHPNTAVPAYLVTVTPVYQFPDINLVDPLAYGE